ncbi:MarR family winged helix-turn-helix transcriptional regulator [Propionicicella superfundia]|uniref:MarR family winged helix-turn-helix transcriptional regulator n=1 Tax=Propionicicella superfundia TaxID=348582 RepID=UPI00042172ED|nr:MarR family transcriptional regulator [Propionicicella superfundia]
MTQPTPQAIAAIRAWYRLDRAFAAASRDMRLAHGLTGEQVALCRIVAERESWSMSELRDRLTMHPATLGQALARLEGRGCVETRPDGTDGRRRLVTMTQRGRDVLARIPVVGPVRLRTVTADPVDLAALAAAFTRAVEVFGLSPWADDPATIDTSGKERT